MRGITLFIVGILMAIFSHRGSLGIEIWTDTESNVIRRYSIDGSVIGTIPSNQIDAMAIVDGELWAVNSVNSLMYHYLPDGTYLGSTTAGAADAMIVVGSEVWTGQRSNTNIHRVDFQGNFIANSSATTIRSMAQVGSEVWTDTDAGVIRRYDLAGNVLGVLAHGSDEMDAMAVVGNEVWTANALNSAMYRYNFSGDYLGSFSTGAADAMIVVGDEVWTGQRALFSIRRLDFQGNYLGTIPATNIHAMVVVPEPSACIIAIVAVSGLFLLRRKCL